ncbi:hypothetical protein CROQUDRAFT_136705 [Cronartium quercuum f. sp. fusiforme G11]|uniref:BHLH domain-containing protein n=1 Tax=Cronartium quercuum f. sp. fusiforme G11 TaxID=708437 RepID=A0A9P6N7I7_9BASI|nr:hypothetical protein CROQUDRAFT_136705 [Cronartium quercuum f. sp. fusiforme G11]
MAADYDLNTISSPTSPSPHQSLFSTSESDSLKGFLEQFASDPILILNKSSTNKSNQNMLITKTSNSNYRTFNDQGSNHQSIFISPSNINASNKHQTTLPLTNHCHPITQTQLNPLQIEFEPRNRHFSSSQSNSDPNSTHHANYHDSQLIQNIRPPQPLSPTEQHHLKTNQQININHHQTTYIPPSNLTAFHHHHSSTNNKTDKTEEDDQVREISSWFEDSSNNNNTSTTSTTGQYVLPSSTNSNFYSQKVTTVKPTPVPINNQRHKHHPSIDSSIERSRNDTNHKTITSRSSLPTSNLCLQTNNNHNQSINEPSSSSSNTSSSASNQQHHIIVKKSSSNLSGHGKKDKIGLLSQEQKRANHIASEQKRRAAIRLGYDKLCEVVPSLKASLNNDNWVSNNSKESDEESLNLSNKTKQRKKRRKVGEDLGLGNMDGRSSGPKSEAVVLAQTVEYLRQLEDERKKLLNKLQLTKSFLQQNGININHHHEKMIWEEKWDSKLHATI